MKVLATILFIVCFSFASFAQKVYQEELDKIEDLYNFALRIYCDSVAPLNADILLIESENLPAHQLPTMIDNIQIRLLSYNNLLRLTSHKKSVVLLKVFPIEKIKGVFSIGINTYKVSRNGKNVEYSLQLGMGIIVNFNYDCNRDAFIAQ